MQWPDDFINKIIQGDCLEVMKQMPDKCVDLVVTSPPYNTGNKSLGYHPNSITGDGFYDQYEDNKDAGEYTDWIISSISECLRVSKYVFWNMQMLSGNKETILDVLQHFRNNFKDIFIWQKQAVSQIVKGRLAKGYEFVFMFGEDNNMTFESKNFPENSYVPNIKTWYKRESIPEHHATFPLDLPAYLVKNFTQPNDTVLDPFLGSGTTAVAAKQLGRNYIGIEISEKYCKIAEDRLRQENLGI